MTNLQPFPFESSERRYGEKPLTLVISDHHAINGNGEGIIKLPWDYIADNVQPELLSSFERVKTEMMENETEEVKPAIVARFGKILFQGGHSDGKEANVTNLAQRCKTFFTNVPISYMDYMSNNVVSKFDLHFEQEKELYHLKLSDKKQPGSIVSCKCIGSKDKEKLELLKVELSPVRNFVADMSCLTKDFDLRLMFCTKKIMTDLTDDEFEKIKLLVSYATIDPEVRGGLRWPLGKNTSGGRYTVCKVWHTTAKTYVSSLFRLKVRQAERYDFRSSRGENSGEVSLKVPGIVSLLQEPTVQNELVSQMLKHNLRLIWEYCLDRSAQSGNTLG